MSYVTTSDGLRSSTWTGARDDYIGRHGTERGAGVVLVSAVLSLIRRIVIRLQRMQSGHRDAYECTRRSRRRTSAVTS